MISADEKLIDEGEVLSYVLPTESELALLSIIAGNKYFSLSEEYLSKDMRQTGTVTFVPLNNLRFFSRGLIKLAEQKRAEGFGDEAVSMVNDLLLVGNQMLGFESDTLITKIVGESIMHDGLDWLLKIYENDDFKIKIITHLDNELDNMRNGSRLLQTAVFHMNNAIVGSPKNTALFFKHFTAQKHNIGSNFDQRLVFNNISLIDGYISDDTKDLEKLALSIMVLPVMLPFELNIGNNYIIYKETMKLAQEPGHEMLNYYFENTFSDFIEKREENRKKAELISQEIFTLKDHANVDIIIENIIDNNQIYFSENNNGYPLVLNYKAYPTNTRPEVSEKLSDNNLKKLSLTPIMTVPDESWIFNVGTASNTDDVYFTVYSMLVYQYTAHQNSPVLKNPTGAGVTVLSAYCYTPNTKTIKKLFSTLDFDELVKKYPAIKSISADGRYLAFDVTPCWGCGGGHAKTFCMMQEVIRAKT